MSPIIRETRVVANPCHLALLERTSEVRRFNFTDDILPIEVIVKTVKSLVWVNAYRILPIGPKRTWRVSGWTPTPKKPSVVPSAVSRGCGVASMEYGSPSRINLMETVWSADCSMASVRSLHMVISCSSIWKILSPGCIPAVSAAEPVWTIPITGL